MKPKALLVAMGMLVFACTGGGASDTTPSPGTDPRVTTTNAVTTSSVAATTTSISTQPIFDRSTLPESAACVIDAPPGRGEPTVVVGARIYGLGADLQTPRCLVAGASDADIEWGPAGDRVRTGAQIHGEGVVVEFFDPAARLEWTAPTGSRVVVVTPGFVAKVAIDGSDEIDITFLETTDAVAYHPAGTHLLAVGTAFDGQYGLWVATNQGTEQLLIAADEEATLSDPAWSWLNEPLFVASHLDGNWHIHRVEMIDGAFQGPIVVDLEEPLDMVMTSPFDPVMTAFRIGGDGASLCVEGARAAVNGVDLPAPLDGQSSSPIGWLSGERLLILAYPDGCDAPADLWSFTAGFCPGSVYGADLLITGVDGAGAREAAPPPPPSPDFTGVIDPAPA